MLKPALSVSVLCTPLNKNKFFTSELDLGIFSRATIKRRVQDVLCPASRSNATFQLFCTTCFL
jgi:hypothetical protein